MFSFGRFIVCACAFQALQLVTAQPGELVLLQAVFRHGARPADVPMAGTEAFWDSFEMDSAGLSDQGIHTVHCSDASFCILECVTEFFYRHTQHTLHYTHTHTQHTQRTQHMHTHIHTHTHTHTLTHITHKRITHTHTRTHTHTERKKMKKQMHCCVLMKIK